MLKQITKREQRIDVLTEENYRLAMEIEHLKLSVHQARENAIQHAEELDRLREEAINNSYERDLRS